MSLEERAQDSFFLSARRNFYNSFWRLHWGKDIFPQSWILIEYPWISLFWLFDISYWFILASFHIYLKFIWVKKLLYISNCRNVLHFFQTYKLSLPSKPYQGEIFLNCHFFFHSRGLKFLSIAKLTTTGVQHSQFLSLCLQLERSDIFLIERVLTCFLFLVWLLLVCPNSWLAMDDLWSLRSQCCISFWMLFVV